MRWIIFFFILIFNYTTLSAKEWKSLRVYKKETQKDTLLPSDWLKQDRTRNTLVWQEANLFNLKNNSSQEYKSISQRRDFYKWLFNELKKKKHEVVWVKMAYFISKKMHLMEVFPYSIFSKKDIKTYAKKGSETVFNNVFIELQRLYNSQSILKTEKALEWDKTILKKEQYEWIDNIYKTIDARNLKTLERIAKGKFLYGLLVPKAVRFKGELSKAVTRYNYAIEVLKPYCENRYK
ncbi:Insecticidal toxin complex protein [Flavivirga spongiicola]|uniref:Insecticidal toxin complex protein n=1 Tax=Flavivirga spongiicola TaxID=421621 RepID=A0ABU7XN01_9FLAO|nr:Insecticidal toxin complex protein [Flavivirga sp. MEBiC05379]MDO5981793.1 Insecticidal toxin complex protein [Flavivirga sp. MEBiC05379]